MVASIVLNSTNSRLTASPSNFNQTSSLALKITNYILPLIKHITTIIIAVIAAHRFYRAWNLSQTNFNLTLSDEFKEEKCRTLLKNPAQIQEALALFQTINKPSSGLHYAILPHVITANREEMVQTICHTLSEPYYMFEASHLLSEKYPEKASQLKEKAFDIGLSKALSSRDDDEKLHQLLRLAKRFKSEPNKIQQVVNKAYTISYASTVCTVTTLCSLAQVCAESKELSETTKNLLNQAWTHLSSTTPLLGRSEALIQFIRCCVNLKEDMFDEEIKTRISNLHNKVVNEAPLTNTDNIRCLINLANCSFYMKDNDTMKTQFDEATSLVVSLRPDNVDGLLKDLNSEAFVSYTEFSENDYDDYQDKAYDFIKGLRNSSEAKYGNNVNNSNIKQAVLASFKIASLYKHIGSGTTAENIIENFLTSINQNTELLLTKSLCAKIIEETGSSYLEGLTPIIETVIKQLSPTDSDDLELAIDILRVYHDARKMDKLEAFLKDYVNQIKTSDSQPINKIINLTSLLSSLFFKDLNNSDKIVYLPYAQQELIIKAIQELAGNLDSPSLKTFIHQLERILIMLDGQKGLDLLQFYESLIREKILSQRAALSRNYMIHAACASAVLTTLIFFPAIGFPLSSALLTLNTIVPLRIPLI